MFWRNILPPSSGLKSKPWGEKNHQKLAYLFCLLSDPEDGGNIFF
jgi:hypothetical protein